MVILEYHSLLPEKGTVENGMYCIMWYHLNNYGNQEPLWVLFMLFFPIKYTVVVIDLNPFVTL